MYKNHRLDTPTIIRVKLCDLGEFFFLQAMFNGGIRKRVMGHNIRYENGSSQRSSASHRGPQDNNIPKAVLSVPEKRLKLEERKPACAETFLEYKYLINTPALKEFYSHTQGPPFNFSADYPSSNQSKAFHGQAGNWSPCREGMYAPPYEMIWARHLGSPESSFAFAAHKHPNKTLPYPKDFLCPTRLGTLTSPRKDVAPMVITDSQAKAGSEERQPSNTSGFKLYRPFEHVIERPHYSAFTPVITSHSPVAPIDFSNKTSEANHNEYVRTRISEEVQETDIEGHNNNPTPQQNRHFISGPSSVSSVSSEHKETDSDDVLDVDTIDEQQEDQNDPSKSEDNSLNGNGETLPEIKERSSPVLNKTNRKVNEESIAKMKQKYLFENNTIIGNTAHPKNPYSHIREEGNMDLSHSYDDVSTIKSISEHSMDNKENIGELHRHNNI